jgi:hypothetical protein
MKHILPILTTSFLLSTGIALYGQEPTPKADETTRSRTATTTDADVTYGRIKELTTGQKVVVDIDNAPDKEFELASSDVTVKLGKGLKVGDPVKVVEHEVAGKTKTVNITKHSGGGVPHGDKDPAAKKP